MSKFKPGTVEKNSSTRSLPAGVGSTPGGGPTGDR